MAEDGLMFVVGCLVGLVLSSLEEGFGGGGSPFGFAQGRLFGDDNQNGNGKCNGLVAGGRFTSHPSR
jgi:hypothetical protein